MKTQVLSLTLLVVGAVAFLENEPRMLQETNSTTIAFASTLQCGGCIRGGNIFCAGPSPAKPSICCRNAAECAT